MKTIRTKTGNEIALIKQELSFWRHALRHKGLCDYGLSLSRIRRTAIKWEENKK